MIRIIAATTVFALSGIPALAQDKAEKTDPKAALVMHNYGKCVAERTPAGADKVLALDPRSREYQTALKKFTTGHDYCLAGGKLGGGGVMFAGALAEARLTHDSRGLAGKLAWREGAVPIEARGELEAVGLCLVRKNPQATVELLGTEPMTSAEAVALKQITPTLSECVANGQQFRVNRPGLRAQIALAAYRIMHLPASGS